MQNSNDLFLKVLKLLRQNDMTQTQLAKKIGISQSSLSKVLSGNYTAKVDTAKKIAKVFNVPAGYLIDEEKPTNDFAVLFSKIELLEEKVKRLDTENILLKKEMENVKEKLKH